jgi:hypothetical protein
LLAVAVSPEVEQLAAPEGEGTRYRVDRLLSEEVLRRWLVEAGFAEVRDGRLALTAEGLEVSACLWPRDG